MMLFLWASDETDCCFGYAPADEGYKRLKAKGVKGIEVTN